MSSNSRQPDEDAEFDDAAKISFEDQSPDPNAGTASSDGFDAAVGGEDYADAPEHENQDYDDGEYDDQGIEDEDFEDELDAREANTTATKRKPKRMFCSFCNRMETHKRDRRKSFLRSYVTGLVFGINRLLGSYQCTCCGNMRWRYRFKIRKKKA